MKGKGQNTFFKSVVFSWESASYITSTNQQNRLEILGLREDGNKASPTQSLSSMDVLKQWFCTKDVAVSSAVDQ